MSEKILDAKEILIKVLELTKEAGYNEINQMVGYLATEAPMYFSYANGSRDLIKKYDHADYLAVLVKEFYANNIGECE